MALSQQTRNTLVAPNGLLPRSNNAGPGAKLTPPPERPTSAEIAQRAYELFEARGRLHGHHHEDWAQAERELTLGRR